MQFGDVVKLPAVHRRTLHTNILNQTRLELDVMSAAASYEL